MLTVNELFSGVGSQRQALINLGVAHRVVGISEIDRNAIKTYELLHGTTMNYGDIREAVSLQYADMWTYSFPYQSISHTGKTEGFKKGSNTKSSVLWEVERLLLNAKEIGTLPKYLVMENVKNLVGVKFIAAFEEWVTVLRDLGYITYWKVINAKDVGVGQGRERTIAVSIRQDLVASKTFAFNEVKLEPKCLREYLEQGFTNTDEDFPLSIERKSGKGKIIMYEVPKKVRLRVYEVNQLDFVNFMREKIKEKRVTKKEIAAFTGLPLTQVEHWFRTDKYGSVPTDEVWPKVKELLCLKRTPYDKSLMTYEERDGVFEQSNRVYDIEGIAPTLTTLCNSVRITDGKKIRTLTVREVWRLMGFADKQIDKLEGKITDLNLYKQAGNSIVVQVLESVFTEIIKLEGDNIE